MSSINSRIWVLESWMMIVVSTDSHPFDVALSWNERSLSFQALLSLWTYLVDMVSQTYTLRFPGWPPSQVGCALGTSVHLHNSASRLPMKVESKITFVKVFFQRLMTAFDGREPGIHETLFFLLIELNMFGYVWFVYYWINARSSSLSHEFFFFSGLRGW